MKRKFKNQPNPGSNEAIERGCNCPRIDNGRGHGFRGVKGMFVKRLDCPLHGEPVEKKESQ